MRHFLSVGTLAGGLLLSILNWFAAAVLPPRYKQFRNPQAVVETVRSNVSSNDIYAVPQGLFVAVSLRDSSIPANFGSRIMGQFLVEFLVAFGLSVLLSMTSIQSPLSAATFLGLAGLVAGIEMHPDLELVWLSDKLLARRDRLSRRNLVCCWTGFGNHPPKACVLFTSNGSLAYRKKLNR